MEISVGNEEWKRFKFQFKMDKKDNNNVKGNSYTGEMTKRIS